jgi:hypothetical protein
MGTHWEQGIKQRNPPPKKKTGPLMVHAEPSHWPHETFISKTVCHHFWPGLKADAQTGGESLGQEI